MIFLPTRDGQNSLLRIWFSFKFFRKSYVQFNSMSNQSKSWFGLHKVSDFAKISLNALWLISDKTLMYFKSLTWVACKVSHDKKPWFNREMEGPFSSANELFQPWKVVLFVMLYKIELFHLASEKWIIFGSRPKWGVFARLLEEKLSQKKGKNSPSTTITGFFSENYAYL